jgi:hypothetical protein
MRQFHTLKPASPPVIASLPKAGVAITYSIARNDLKQMLTTINY